MATFGWVLIAGAFLILIMVANNSWSWVWAKISGTPAPGSQGGPQGGGRRPGIGEIGPIITNPALPPGTPRNPLPSIEIGVCQPTVDGTTNVITGADLDRSRPICRWGPLAGG